MLSSILCCYGYACGPTPLLMLGVAGCGGVGGEVVVVMMVRVVIGGGRRGSEGGEYPCVGEVGSRGVS